MPPPLPPLELPPFIRYVPPYCVEFAMWSISFCSARNSLFIVARFSVWPEDAWVASCFHPDQDIVDPAVGAVGRLEQRLPFAGVARCNPHRGDFRLEGVGNGEA